MICHVMMTRVSQIFFITCNVNLCQNKTERSTLHQRAVIYHDIYLDILISEIMTGKYRTDILNEIPASSFTGAF